MKTIFVVLSSFFYLSSVFAQEVIEIQEEHVQTFAEVEPQFPGGESAMMNYIMENIEYPKLAVENGYQGIVYVMFIVEADGTLSDVHVVRGVEDPLDDEAVRVVEAMPTWKPGEMKGEKVRVRYTLPIHFRLTKEKSLSKKELKQIAKDQKKRDRQAKKK